MSALAPKTVRSRQSAIDAADGQFEPEHSLLAFPIQGNCSSSQKAPSRQIDGLRPLDNGFDNIWCEETQPGKLPKMPLRII